MKETALIAASALMLGLLLGGNTIYNGDDFTYQHVNYTGTIYSGGYQFDFQEEINQNKNIDGLSYNLINRVVLRTDRSAGEIMDTCRHEVLHQYFSNYQHPNFSKPGISKVNDPIYRLEDKVELPVCDRVVATALQRQR